MYRETSEAPIGEAVTEVSPLDSFISFLEKKPADETFVWMSWHRCAIAQWWSSFNPRCPSPYALGANALPQGVTRVVYEAKTADGTRNFGTVLAAVKSFRRRYYL